VPGFLRVRVCDGKECVMRIATDADEVLAAKAVIVGAAEPLALEALPATTATFSYAAALDAVYGRVRLADQAEQESATRRAAAAVEFEELEQKRRELRRDEALWG
jgi:hypothetical protein